METVPSTQECFNAINDLGKKFKAGEIPFETRGHAVDRDHFERDALWCSFAGHGILTLKEGQWYKFRKTYCSNCGDEIRFETNGKVIRGVEDCPHPNGFPPTIVRLNVPSGKIVFANDLRDKFRVIGDYSVNYAIGMLKTSKKYEEMV